jgi:hypothetical protein
MTNRVLKCAASTAKADEVHLSQWLEQEPALPRIAGVHPFVLPIALSGVAWFLAVAWLDFSDGLKVGLVPALAVGLLVMYLTLFLLAVPVRLQQAGSHRVCASRRD